MAELPWHAFANGSSVGQAGSEEGVIVRDEEHLLGARITLEHDSPVAPFAITCGIYGWMVHTRYFGSAAEAVAQYEQMRAALGALLESAEQDAPIDGGRQVLFDGIARFIEEYP